MADPRLPATNGPQGGGPGRIAAVTPTPGGQGGQAVQPTPAMIDRANDALLTGFLGLIMGLGASGPNAHVVHEFIARVINVFPGGFDEVGQHDPNDLVAMRAFTRRACNQVSLVQIIQEANVVQSILQTMTPCPVQALAGLEVLRGQAIVALVRLNPVATVPAPVPAPAPSTQV